jgi:hypothetical protein
MFIGAAGLFFFLVYILIKKDYILASYFMLYSQNVVSGQIVNNPPL